MLSLNRNQKGCNNMGEKINLLQPYMLLEMGWAFVPHRGAVGYIC